MGLGHPHRETTTVTGQMLLPRLLGLFPTLHGEHSPRSLMRPAAKYGFSLASPFGVRCRLGVLMPRCRWERGLPGASLPGRQGRQR